MDGLTEKGALNIYQMVGRFILMYGRIEMHLTYITTIVWEDVGGQNLRGWSKFPKHMASRHRFLTESFDALGPLRPFRAEWESIQADMKRPEQIRHGVVHGVWDGKLGDLTFRRIAHDGSPDAEIMTITEHELSDLDDVFFGLVGRAEEFASRLEKAFVPQ